MDGVQAFEYLKNMSVGEREAVNIIWFDKDCMTNNGVEKDDAEAELILHEVEKMSNEEIGKILDSSLFNRGGDIHGYYNEFLDRHADMVYKKIKEHLGLI